MKEKPYTPPFRELEIRWHPSSPPLEPREVVGMYFLRSEDGYAVRCYQSDGKLWSFPKDLEDWFKVKDDRMFFTDGGERELESVLKYLGKEACERILMGCDVNVGGVVISYHGSLSTRIAGGKSLRHIWQLKPFYPAYMTPDQDDCYGVQARGERLVKAMIANGLPLAMNSCGSVLSALADLPFNDCPADVTEYAYNSYHGGWVESMKLGFFPEAFDYDLTSAYPTEAAHLYSCSPRCGSWYHVGQFIQEALYGFAWCKIHMDIFLPFSPIMVRLRSYMSASGTHPIRVLRNPIGGWEGWMTKDEIEFVVRNWLGSVEVLDGVWFVPIRYTQPFLPLVSRLNQMRMYGKSQGDKLTSYIGKIIPASLQGKFIQSSIIDGRRVAGTAFHPVYASTITSRVRLRVAEAALEDYDHILGVMVDGVLSDKPLPLGRKWKTEYKGECVIANHGEYDMPGRDTTLPLRKLLADNEGSGSYPMKGARYVSLAEAIEGNAFEYAGRRNPESFASVRSVGKRNWISLPRTCGDLLENQYESGPLWVTQKAPFFTEYQEGERPIISVVSEKERG